MFSLPTRALLGTICLSIAFNSAAFAEIEAVKGKRHNLHKVHGPWMVMVASMRDVPEERRTKDGLSAWEAADQLVYELRLKGIPAYTYLQGQKVGTLASPGSYTSASDTRKYICSPSVHCGHGRQLWQRQR